MLAIVRGERGEGHFHQMKEANDILERQEHSTRGTTSTRSRPQQGGENENEEPTSNKRAILATTAPRGRVWQPPHQEGEFGNHRNKGEYGNHSTKGRVWRPPQPQGRVGEQHRNFNKKKNWLAARKRKGVAPLGRRPNL